MTDLTNVDQIREKIKETISNLEQKQQLLERHKTQYNDFKFKLYDLDQHKERDTPEIPVYLNSKGRVKGHMTHPKKILVFLGCEYFVERDPKTALIQVENKLNVLNKAIEEFKSQIKDAKKTIENIGHLESFEKKQKIEEVANDSGNSNNAMNEDSLPFMDIREELDEDGNIISSSVNPQDKKALDDFGKTLGDVEITEEEQEDELNELLRDMEITPKQAKKIEEVFDDVVDAKEEESIDIEIKSDKTVQNKSRIAVSSTETGEHEDEPKIRIKEDRTLINKPHEHDKEPSHLDEDDDYYRLMKEMGIIDAIPSSENRQGSSEKQTLNQISTEDLDQLQQISNELVFDDDDDDNDYYEYDYDDDELDLEVEEYDYEIGGDQNEQEVYEKGEEGDEDWDFTKSEDNIVPNSHRDLFMKELERIRKQSSQSFEQEVTKDFLESNEEKPSLQEEKKKQKKTVSFASKLEIKEIENVSEELKKPDIKVSKFKQSRSGVNNSFSPTVLSDIIDKDTITANDNIKEYEPIISNIVENESVTLDVVEREPVLIDSLDKFDKESPSIVAQESEPVTSDILEKKPVSSGISESNSQESAVSAAVLETNSIKRVSKFKSRFKQDSHPTNPTSRNPEATRELSGSSQILVESIESSVVKQHQDSTPTVIEPPMNDISYVPIDDYANIKAYVENDEEDEDALLNDMVDEIDVYVQGEEHEERDSEDDQAIDESKYDGEYGPVLLDDIVENDEIDDPDYFVDDGLLEKEYKELRSRMISRYAQETKKDKIIVKEEEGQELEPIDEHGNPIKVSRFRKSLGRSS